MMTLLEFAAKWKGVTQTEKAASQSHFIDLCHALGQKTPTDADPTGESYAFEKHVAKVTAGDKGFADVWKRGFFGWEYKGKHKDLNAAYVQLNAYHDALENPPLLVVCDMERFEVHVKVTNNAKQIFAFNLDDIAANVPTATCPLPPADVLRALFEKPGRLTPHQSPEEVTEEVAREFAQIAVSLEKAGHDRHDVARFLIRLVFCLFAEDVGLLEGDLFTRTVRNFRDAPDLFARRLRELFREMATGGGFGDHRIPHFNGGLFDAKLNDATDADDENAVLPLTGADLSRLLLVAQKDWRRIEPSVFGTLFERSLGDKRAQLGAHYTRRADIEAIVEPVLMPPLRRRWAQIQQIAEVKLLALRRLLAAQKPGVAAIPAERRALQEVRDELTALLQSFTGEIAAVRVLDPACGSGNFLYVALRYLLDLEYEVIQYAARAGLSGFFPKVGPEQMAGIEINDYAHELAPVTLWIGYIQWLRENGYGQPAEPILRRMDMVQQRDALLSGAWPAADYIVGNPPFLGGSKLRRELGDAYVERLWKAYENRVPAAADFVCYWFEIARQLIADGKVKRAGFLSTNSIRGGANRRVLERIKESGDIFMAYADREWVLEGAAVRVSMVGFDNGTETERTLDGSSTVSVNPDLTRAEFDLTSAKPLAENLHLCFRSDEKGGSFDIDHATAKAMLAAKGNPNGKFNSDVVRPYLNGLDLVRRPRNVWIIDFGVEMPEEEAALYEMPFEYVLKHVRPEREKVRNEREGQYWWLHRRPAPDMRKAVKGLSRFIVTPRVAKHRVFAWVSGDVIPDCQIYSIARDDDYFIGVLHSRVHEIWTLKMCTWLGMGNDPRYTPTTTFETFPFPYPPGTEPVGSSTVEAIAETARKLVTLRDNWLNPEGATPAELKQRTLTNLYNQRPTWLQNAHRALDDAVFAAYGWTQINAAGKALPETLTDDEILARLLALNHARAYPSEPKI